LIGEKIKRDRGATRHCAHIDGRGGLKRGGQVTRKRIDIPGPGSGLVGIFSNQSGQKRPLRMAGAAGDNAKETIDPLEVWEQRRMSHPNHPYTKGFSLIDFVSNLRIIMTTAEYKGLQRLDLLVCLDDSRMPSRPLIELTERVQMELLPQNQPDTKSLFSFNFISSPKDDQVNSLLHRTPYSNALFFFFFFNSLRRVRSAQFSALFPIFCFHTDRAFE
jgi:hypothetical protein